MHYFCFIFTYIGFTYKGDLPEKLKVFSLKVHRDTQVYLENMVPTYKRYLDTTSARGAVNHMTTNLSQVVVAVAHRSVQFIVRQ